MAIGRQAIEGSGNIQVSGNNNCVVKNYYSMSGSVLTHSFIHDLLDIVYSLPPSDDDSYSLRQPARMHSKLEFNRAQRYMEIIDNHADDYARVDEVMKDYPNSEDIVKKLRDMFIDAKHKPGENGLPAASGDQQLDEIKSELFSLIVTDSKFDADAYCLEKIEQFCVALIAYGISKCKILETPM